MPCVFDVVTTGEAARFLGLSHRRIRQLCQSGELICRNTDSGYIIELSFLGRYRDGERLSDTHKEYYSERTVQ